MTDLTNQFIGGYHFQWKIASGGMATVYRGQRADDPNAPQVALKVLHAHYAENRVARARFRREAEIGQRLRHPNIASVIQLVEAQGWLFMVMPYLAGGSLAERIAKEGALPWLDALDILKQVGRALDFAHSQGIVHRDVKPSNILFDEFGDAKLADFGVAHEEDASTLTETGFQPGTVAYMAPEQIQGRKATAASDQFSLAVVFYRMVSGVSPFEGTTATALSYHIVNKPPRKLPRRGDIPGAAQKTLDKALAKEPAARFPAIADFVRALQQAGMARGGGFSAGKAGAGLLLVLALVALGGFSFLRNRSHPATPEPSPPAAAAVSQKPTATFTSTLSPTPSDNVAKAEKEKTLTPPPPTNGGAIAQPPPTSTPTANPANDIPTLAPTAAIPTLAPTPTLIVAPPTPRPRSTPTNASAAGGAPARIQIALLNPPENDNFSGGDITFKWQVQSGALGGNQKFELLFYHCNEDPMRTGFSPVGATTETQVAVNLKGADDSIPQFTSGDWCWGVAAGHERKNGSWGRDMLLAAGRPFHYSRPGDGGGGGGNNPPGVGD